MSDLDAMLLYCCTKSLPASKEGGAVSAQTIGIEGQLRPEGFLKVRFQQKVAAAPSNSWLRALKGIGQPREAVSMPT